MKKFLTILAALSLCACAGKPAKTFTKSDMSGYDLLTDKDPVFVDMTVKDMVEQMDAGQTLVVYFGFSNCPWCREAVPVLDEAAKEAGYTVGYVNTRADASWKSNTDIADYDLLIERVGDYLAYDNEGKRHLYVPFVFFIKDGKVAFVHSDTVEGHDPKQSQMTDEQRAALKAFYMEGFASLK